MTKKKQRPWWTGECEEVCPHCLQTYGYQAEYRCEDCDAPICPCCAEAQLNQPVTCPECRDGDCGG